ncbi:alpha/beta fold hydrolase [Nocardia sp. NPDC058058]|uniref:alpha/beta fold hydrolase n=1 Tax=Nocardia sp. NPDC058058 TaxID=3346317 RepID=UPI0036D88D0B
MDNPVSIHDRKGVAATRFLTIGQGRIAYDAMGEGPLVVMAPGAGDLRQVYRFLAPKLAEAGYRVITVDLRGHGESSMYWASHDGGDVISHTDIAGDLLAVIRALGGPAVIVGHSISGGAATIAAARAPGLVRGVIELNPFTRTQTFSPAAFLTNHRYRLGMIWRSMARMRESPKQWVKYLNVAYPIKPPDYREYIAELSENLCAPGRFDELLKTIETTPADAEAQLPNLIRPALIIMGTKDPDFPDPEAEGLAIAALMPEGLGTVALSEGSGHCPHADAPDRVAELALNFLAEKLER